MEVEYDENPYIARHTPSVAVPSYEKPAVTIVVDIANLCYGYLKSITSEEVNTKTVPPLLAFSRLIHFFKVSNYARFADIIKIVGICPRWWSHEMEREPYSENSKLFFSLKQEGALYLCESAEHDDEFILTYSYRKAGFVVSNDLYRDHVKNNFDGDWLKDHRIGYMWIGNDFVPSPGSLSNLEHSLEELSQNNQDSMEIDETPLKEKVLSSLQEQTPAKLEWTKEDIQLNQKQAQSRRSEKKLTKRKSRSLASKKRPEKINWAKEDVLLLETMMEAKKNKMEIKEGFSVWKS